MKNKKSLKNKTLIKNKTFIKAFLNLSLYNTRTREKKGEIKIFLYKI